MRILLAVFLSLLLAGCASSRKQAVTSVEIKEIEPRFIEEENFKRISEYLSGGENQGRRLILRSDPEERTGFYFTLFLDEKLKRLPNGTVVVGEFHTPKSLDVQTHEFKLPSKRPRTKEVFVGLTGEDWTYGEEMVPSAWRFTIKDANGNVLGEKKSYLWSF